MVLIWLITGNNYVIINLLLSYMVLLVSIPLSKYYHKFYMYCHNDNIKKLKTKEIRTTSTHICLE